ncbi:hypothetical protein [Hydrogenophaga sp. 5NK40-0174]|uniref:hypothetical protein n=1 Tax=Hydrogenophaga sp. 5NK40-0174 TaxID=3127649 RepID=UPI00310237B4
MQQQQEQPTPSAFDSAAWKAQRGVSPVDNKRVQMVSALQSAVQVGMKRSEVIALLGEPDSSDAASGADKYRLGLAMGPDEQFYEIRYEADVVKSAALGQF